MTIPATTYKMKTIVPINVTAKRGAAFVGGVTTQYTIVRPDKRKNKISLLSSAKGTTIWYFRPPMPGVYSVSAVSTKGAEKANSNVVTFTVN